MKTFSNTCAQGDVYFRRVQALPNGVKLAGTVNGNYVIAHSETGHSHVMEAATNVKLYSTDDPMVSYLQIVEATDAVETLLKHMRSFDTHETIKFSPGIYEIRRQREATPEGWRRVED
jgi:hypothetical protein